MSPETIGCIGVGVMLVLMFVGIPIAISMAVVGFVGYAAICGFDKALAWVGIVPYSTFAEYTLSVLPIYMLMGEFADISGMMRDSYRTSNIWLGFYRGGLAMASIIGAGIFSAISGSSMACAALMTKISLPSLLDDYKYDPKLATGALTAGGTLGNLVPPGMAYVIYALMSETSVGKLYIASIIPGILLALMYMAQIYIQCRINPSLGPRGAQFTWKQKLVGLKHVMALAIIFLMIMGGIWTGIFTATEAGAVGTVFCFFLALYRRSVTWKNLIQTLRNTIAISGMIFAVILGASIFTYFLSVSRLAQELAEFVLNMHMSPLGVIIMIMVVYIILGTAMDTVTMILLTVPIFLNIVTALGIDLIWFGVLVIVQVELSAISPPVGGNLFVVAGMVKNRGISIGTVFWGATPFCITMVIFTAIIIAFPQLSLFLVHMMK